MRTDHTSKNKILNSLLLLEDEADHDENEIDLDQFNDILHDFEEETPSTQKNERD